jgi:hypothetical protein
MAQCKYDPEQYWPTFIMKKGSDLFKFVLSQDPEGNGGGFAFIEDL